MYVTPSRGTATPAGSAHRRLRRTQLRTAVRWHGSAAFEWVLWEGSGVLFVCLFVFKSRALLRHTGVGFRETLRRRPLPPGGTQLPPRRAAREQPYLSISALQSHHELRVVLVRFLGQLKGLLDLQQLLLGAHGRGAVAGPAPRGPGRAPPTAAAGARAASN